MSNIFESKAFTDRESNEQANVRYINVPDYSVSPSGIFDHILAFALGFAVGFAVMFIFYKITILSIIGGLILGGINIFYSSQKAIKKRKHKLRTQFFDLLEAMSVSMRAGNPPLKALESSVGDLSLIYSKDSDIITELNIIIGKFNNAVPLSESFSDFAERSGLEDIESFASIYATIEGKSSRTDEIIRETQQIIADKMEVEMEIETLMTAAKSEVNIMLLIPLVILGVISYAGAGFMDAIYTTRVGQIVSTGGLIILFISFILASKFSNIEL